MHKRVVLAVSTLLFALLAAVSWIVTDMHDRSFPDNLNATAAVGLDFSTAAISDDEAFATLGRYSDQLDLGLVKVAPDLTGDQQAQVFVSVGSHVDRPRSIDRFGDQPDATVKDRGALANSYASGQYLVTGDPTGAPELQAWLRETGVTSRWQADDVPTTLELVVKQDSFALSLLATATLLVSLVVYWLAVKARGRALRVLYGAQPWRVQADDLGGFFQPLALSAPLVCVAATAFVAATQGFAFVGYYLSTLVLFGMIVLTATFIGAVVMSAISAPDEAMLATRRPAIGSIRRVSIVVQVVTFAIVLAAVAPAFHALAESRTVAAQQAKWRSLSDQVALSFPGALGENGFVALMPAVGAVVADAERNNAVAFSYTWTKDNLDTVDLGPSGPVAFVNQRWIDLMLTPAGIEAGGPAGTSRDLPPAFQAFLAESLPLWSRAQTSSALSLDQVPVRRLSADGGIPLALGGNGELVFPPTATLIVVPSPHEQFNDDFLASLSSTGNLVFDGLGKTEELLSGHDLAGTVELRLVAEEGVLRAQVAEYTAWLKGLAFVALVVALVISTLVAAFIGSVLNVRRDFPLRLAGRPWREILSGRFVRDAVPGLVLVAAVGAVSSGPDVPLVLAVGSVALLVAPLAHVITARWAFSRARVRRL